MPTKLRRVMLSMPDDVDQLMTRMAKATRTPKATAIVQVLIESKPMIESIIDIFEKIQADKKALVNFQQQSNIEALNQFMSVLTLNSEKANTDPSKGAKNG